MNAGYSLSCLILMLTSFLLSVLFTIKCPLKIFILELEMAKVRAEISVFTFGFAKGILLEGQRRPLSVLKATF